MELTTEQIVHLIDAEDAQASYDWIAILDDSNITGNPAEDKELMLESAKFLESWKPGKRWSAKEFGKLLDNHLSGRYDSAETIGHIRVSEELEDENISQAGYDRYEEGNNFADFIRQTPGDFLWDATDKPGTVLYFHGLIYVEVLLQDD